MTTATKTVGTLRENLEAFQRSMRSDNLSPRTQKIYTRAVEALAKFLDDADVASVTRADVEKFIDEERQRTSAASAALAHRCLQQFFRWAVKYPLIKTSPMEDMRHPKVAETSVKGLEKEEENALIATCAKGTSFIAKRDHALIRVLLHGLRRSEAADLKLEEIDLKDESLFIAHGKGDKSRRVPLSITAVDALDHYIRARRKHPNWKLEHLFVGHQGRLTHIGVAFAITERGKQAGIEKLHCHKLRHTAVHNWLSGTGSETGLMKIMGWSSPNMLRRYDAPRQENRAMAEARRIGFGV